MSQYFSNAMSFFTPKIICILAYFRPISSGVKTKVGDIEIGDVDDFDIELAALDLGPRLPVGKTLQNNVDSRPIDVKTAVVQYTSCYIRPSLLFNNTDLLMSE